MRRFVLTLVLLTAAQGAAAAGTAAPVNVALQVSEWAGVPRRGEVFTGGVPIAAGLIKNVDGLCLTDDKGQAVPAQFAPLVRDKDGFVRWVLVDGLTDLDSAAGRAFTLKTGRNVSPREELRIQRSGDMLEVTTGPMRFSVNCRRYNFLDTVWIDADGDGQFSRPERVVVPSTSPNLLVQEMGTNVNYTSLGSRPKTPRFEYKGPLRAVLVMEGDLADDQGRVFLGYRTRITTFAGKALLLVEHSLRNSRGDRAFDAPIRAAELTLPLADDLTQYHLGLEEGKTADGTLLEGDTVTLHAQMQGGPGVAPTPHYGAVLTGRQGPRQVAEGGRAPGWLFASSAARGVFVYDRDFVHDAPSRFAQAWGRLTYEDLPSGEPPLLLPDMTHEVCRLAIDFAARPLDRIQPAETVARVLTPLVALADPAHVARLGALGGPFATVEDEIRVYRDVWKWKWDEKRRPVAPPAPQAYLKGEAREMQAKGDALRDCALELVRTRGARFYHLAAAAARHYAYEAAWRTDDFDLRAKPVRFLEDMARRRAKFTAAYECIAGLADWYCLTGDVEAMEAAIDSAEYAAASWKAAKPGAPEPFSGRPTAPDFAPMLEGLCRVYTTTFDAGWLAPVEHMVSIAAQAPSKDERGFFRLPVTDPPEEEAYGPKASLLPMREAAAVSRPLWQAYRITAGEDARDLVSGIGAGVMRHGGLGVQVAHVDALAMAYDVTGDAKFLEAAKEAWARASMALVPPAGRPGAPQAEVGKMLHESNASGGGTIDAWARLFFWYTAHPREDTKPPKPVADFAASPGPSKTSVYLSWTAPEDRGGARAALYQVKQADLPIVEYKDFDYAKDKDRKRAWWFAQNLTGEPNPAKPGTKERFLVRGLKPGTHYFALKSRDDSGNESAISNVVMVEIK